MELLQDRKEIAAWGSVFQSCLSLFHPLLQPRNRVFQGRCIVSNGFIIAGKHER